MTVSMSSSNLGRHVFGLATLAFGLVTLAAPDYYDWLELHWSARDGRIFAYAASAVQIVGGAAIQFPRTVKAGAVILGAVYLIFALASIPRIIATPAAFYPWGDFFNQFAMVVGATIVYMRLSPAVAPKVVDRLGRILFGVCTVSFTLYQAFYLAVTAGLVPKWVPPSQMFWSVATTVFLALAALALLTNLRALLASRLLTLLLASFGVLVWIPAVILDPHNHFKWTETTETFAIVGSAWILADFLGAYRPANKYT